MSLRTVFRLLREAAQCLWLYLLANELCTTLLYCAVLCYTNCGLVVAFLNVGCACFVSTNPACRLRCRFAFSFVSQLSLALKDAIIYFDEINGGYDGKKILAVAT